MRTATALAAIEPIRGQIPLPFPRSATVVPLPRRRPDSRDPLLHHRAPRLVQALVETLAGRRPLRQLEPWLERDLFGKLAHRLRVGTRRPISRTARLASLHISEVCDGIAEVAARLEVEGRSQAIALRLERVEDIRGRVDWRCAALVWA